MSSKFSKSIFYRDISDGIIIIRLDISENKYIGNESKEKERKSGILKSISLLHHEGATINYFDKSKDEGDKQISRRLRNLSGA